MTYFKLLYFFSESFFRPVFPQEIQNDFMYMHPGPIFAF